MSEHQNKKVDDKALSRVMGAIFIACVLVVGVYFVIATCLAGRAASQEAAICQGRTCTTSGVDYATRTNQKQITVDAAGALLVTGSTGAVQTVVAPQSLWEYKTYDIPAASASGTNLNATSTSTLFIVTNESTSSSVRIAIGSTASATSGILLPKSGVSGDSRFGLTGIFCKSISIYNTGSATATVSIMYGR